MPLPQPPRGDPLDEAILIWAESGRRLAADLRNAPPAPPSLCIIRNHQALGFAILISAYVYVLRVWQHTYHCACIWHLAFEIHPVYRGVHWAVAIAVSIAWQLYDRLNAVTGGKPGVGGPGPLSGQRPGITLDHRHRLPAGDGHGVHRVTACI